MRILSGYQKFHTVSSLHENKRANPAVSYKAITAEDYISRDANNSRDKGMKPYVKAILGLGSIAMAVFLVTRFNSRMNISRNGYKVGSEVVSDLKTMFKNTVKNYPDDARYYNQLAAAAGLKRSETYKLNSIVGQSQLTDLLDKYKPVDFHIGQNLIGVQNQTYRVNLHNHTTCSDGKMSVAELLEQSRKWADKIAKNKNDSTKPPFTIAITDHDTLEGAREAVKILSSNPEKYKNLKVVLGSEISMSYVNPKDVKQPLNHELIAYCVNPYNKTLNSVLDNLRNSRITTVKKIIDEINTKFPNLKLNWNEASQFHPNLAKGTSDGSIWLLRQYAAFKGALNQYCSESKIKNLNPDALFKPLSEDYLKKVDLRMLNDGDVERYFRIFKLGKLEMNPSFTLDKGFQKAILDIRDSYVYNADKLLENKVILTPEIFFDAYKKSGDKAFFGLAHPGYLNTSVFSDDIADYCRKYPKNDAGHHLAWRLFKHLKKVGGDSFKAYEGNYQFYGNEPGRAEWARKMNALGALGEFKLYKTGGADCHETSIFFKHEKLTPQKAAQYNLSEIVEKSV